MESIARPRAAAPVRLALATAIALIAAWLAAPALAASGEVALVPATRMHTGDVVMGPMAQSQPIHVVVTLKPRNTAQLDALLARPNRKPLSTQQFIQQYSPTAQQAAAVADFLRGAGFTNIQIAKNRLLVSADGSAATAQTAFQTSLVRVHTHDGRSAYAHSGPINIPGALQSVIASVQGLQTVFQYHTYTRVAPAAMVGTQAVQRHDPTEFPSIYEDTHVPTASGITIGIVSQGDLTNVLSDLNQFTTNHSLAAVTTQVININGTSTDTTNQAEFDLDSQSVVGMAGGQVGQIIFYNIPSLTGANLTLALNRIVTDNQAKIINVSLGGCETLAKASGDVAADDPLFQQAVAQGQTFSISSGDSGADECPSDGSTSPIPAYPASSQYVVAVGGTTLDASTTTWNSATTWSGTGGSPSTFESMPIWQQGVVSGSGGHRGVPDISYDADPASGATIIVNGSTAQIGGTSLAAPLFSGAWARVLAAHGTGYGFAAPKLYQWAVQRTSAYRDITTGNNGAETAAIGWDYTTGWGSMRVSRVLAPGATDGSVSTHENVAGSGTLSISDWDTDTLTAAVVTGPSHGTVSIDNAATGAFTYTPSSNYTGTDSFTFNVADSAGVTSDAGTELITVYGPPVATDGSVGTEMGMPVSNQLKGSDPDSKATLTFSIVTQPSHGTANIDNAATGAFTYTPTAGYTGADSLTFQVSDNDGVVSNTATETLTTYGPPVASNGSISGAKSISIKGSLHASDPDGDTHLTYSIVSQPSHGAVSLTNASTGAFTYVPAAGYTGSDSFTFQAKDSNNISSNTATENVTMTAPSSGGGGGGGGAFGLWGLLGLALLGAGHRQAAR